MRVRTFCDLFTTEIEEAGFKVDELRNDETLDTTQNLAERARSIVNNPEILQKFLTKLGHKYYHVHMFCTLLGKEHFETIFPNDRKLQEFLNRQHPFMQGTVYQTMGKIFDPLKMSMVFHTPAAVEASQDIPSLTNTSSFCI